MTSVVFTNDHLLLPPELLDTLNQAYFLYLLATEPSKVVPPGKSLLSMMVHAQLESGKGKGKHDAQPLLDRVKEVAHKAFWDEALETLSNPQPAIQLPRLKGLYNDLYDSLNPLYSPGHRILMTLRAPLAPTSSPLQSNLAFLKELLLSLKERCAPVRDNEINELYQRLDDWHDLSLPDDHNHSPPPLASLLADTMRRIVSLADVMKSDLNTAILGTMSEDEVKGMVFRKAKEQERQVVLRLQGRGQEADGIQLVQEKWRSWIAELPETEPYIPQDKRWIPRLMKALESNQAVSCDVYPIVSSEDTEKDESTSGPSEINRLPPQFLFASRQLFYIQNYMQAISIAATLRLLAKLPTQRPDPTVPASPDSTFMARIWTLLKMEVETEETNSEDPDEATKLVNLADEVIHARRLASPSNVIDAAVEARLREAVDHTLRPQDPVFMLLRRRLINSIGEQLLIQLTSPSPGRVEQVPEVMKSGRGHPKERPTKRARLTSSEDAVLPPYGLSEGTMPSFIIKGFEDPVLLKAINKVFVKTLACIQWEYAVWGDLG